MIFEGKKLLLSRKKTQIGCVIIDTFSLSCLSADYALNVCCTNFVVCSKRTKDSKPSFTMAACAKNGLLMLSMIKRKTVHQIVFSIVHITKHHVSLLLVVCMQTRGKSVADEYNKNKRKSFSSVV